MLDNSNRIIDAIARMEKQVGQRISGKITTSEKLEELHKSLDISLDEFVKFQELKSLACVEGKLTLDEAQTIYNYLGNTPDTFNRQSVYVKTVLTKVFHELLLKRTK